MSVGRMRELPVCRSIRLRQKPGAVATMAETKKRPAIIALLSATVPAAIRRPFFHL